MQEQYNDGDEVEQPSPSAIEGHPQIHCLSVPTFPGPRATGKPRTKATLCRALGSVLSEIGETLQELPLPAFDGAVVLLQALVRRWQNNLPIHLVEGMFDCVCEHFI